MVAKSLDRALNPRGTGLTGQTYHVLMTRPLAWSLYRGWAGREALTRPIDQPWFSLNTKLTKSLTMASTSSRVTVSP
jgi:hypothetical protein